MYPAKHPIHQPLLVTHFINSPYQPSPYLHIQSTHPINLRTNQPHQELQQQLDKQGSTDTAATAAAALTKKQVEDLTTSCAKKDSTIEQLQTTISDLNKTVNELKLTVSELQLQAKKDAEEGERLQLQAKKDTEEGERLKKQVFALADTKKALVVNLVYFR